MPLRDRLPSMTGSLPPLIACAQSPHHVKHPQTHRGPRKRLAGHHSLKELALTGIGVKVNEISPQFGVKKPAEAGPLKIALTARN